jgi:hypothetical protein
VAVYDSFGMVGTLFFKDLGMTRINPTIALYRIES